MNEKDIIVAIVEDEDEIRELLEAIIDRSPGFTCKHVFKDCESALNPLKSIKPDVVLMDIQLPGISGIEGIKLLKPELNDTDFIMLTIRDEDEMVFESLCAGATGYLLKDTPPVRLLNAIKEVREGGSPMSPGIARKIVISFQPSRSNPLTEREQEVLENLAKGENYTTISEKLFISGNTVRAHIKNIYRKLEVNSRAAAVNTAIKQKLI
ncbi:MAG TPA: response regulator transcription factor [Bacteroidales bacterium]|nr:response regulator transcription factor [Bacteroidales bacterium]HRX95700.1 response regulator transcription factor [Bacteroidales bacterium]